MVTVTQFKAKCLGLITQVERDKKPVLITKNGRVAARLQPIAEHGQGGLFGRSKKSTIICGDLLETGECWDAQD